MYDINGFLYPIGSFGAFVYLDLSTKPLFMKKIFLAAIIGGLILFIWQFISWAGADFHNSTQQYTEKQQAIMEFLNAQQLEEGGYVMPILPKTATMEEWQELMKDRQGKPWASIQYHTAMNDNMILNMVRSFIINVLTVFLFCWIIGQFKNTSFRTILSAALLTGLIVFFNVPYINFIWYKSFDIWVHLADAIVSWGICGAWLGWWFNKKNKALSDLKVSEQPVTVAAE